MPAPYSMLTNLRWLSIVALLTTAAIGCDRDAGSLVHRTVRDSAGVRIVDNEVLAVDEQFHRATESAIIGHDGGDDADHLFRVSGAAVLSNGTIAIANGGVLEIRFYRRDGTFLRSVGRAGEGPGEFRRVNALQKGPGDSVFVWDELLDRVTAFDSAGNVGRLVSLGRFRGALPPGNHVSAFLGVTASGAVIVSSRHGEATFEQRARDTLDIVAISPDGEPSERLASLLGREHFMRVEPELRNMRISWSPPFARSGSARAQGNRIVVYDAEPDELRLYDQSGLLTTRARGGYPVRALTDEQQNQFIRDSLGAQSGVTAEPWQRMVRDVGFPRQLHAFTNIRLDEAGRIWGQWPRLPAEDTTYWSVFDPDGVYVAVVASSGPGTLLAVSCGTMLLLDTDEFDVERVRILEYSQPHLGQACD